MPTMNSSHDSPTLLHRFKRVLITDSVEFMALRICCIAMSVALVLYLLIQYATYGSSYVGDWYGYLISGGLVLCAVFMVTAAVVGKRVWLRYSLYWNAVVLLFATVAFPVAYAVIPDLAPSVLRFADFTGVLAVSVVLLCPTNRAVIAAIFIQAVPAALHAFIHGRTSLPELLATSGFAVLMNLIPFVLGALTLMRVARTIDETEVRVRDSLAESESKKAAIGERKRLNGLVHDHILASLAAVARGQSLRDHTEWSLPSRPATGEDVPMQFLLDDVTRRLQEIVPDCTVTTTGIGPDGSVIVAAPTVIKASAAEAIRLSVAEAARNSRKHAGAGSQRWCDINVTDNELIVEFRDNGRGFDVDQRDPQRSGITVSILHRMRSIDGGDAQVVSEPGVGTTVTIRWCLSSPESQQFGANAEVSDEVTEAELTAGSLQKRMLQPAHVSRSWARPYLLLAVPSVLSAAWISSGSFLAALPAAFLSIAVLALILLDDAPRMDRKKFSVVIAGVILIGPLSLWQNADYSGSWENQWAIAISGLISCILVLRGEIIWGVAGFAANIAVLETISLVGGGAIANPPLITWSSYIILLFAAAIVYFANSGMLKRLPSLRAKKWKANAEAARIRQIQAMHKQWHERIELDAAPVFEAVQHFDSPPPLLRQRAHLTELAIRDALRAPLLDRPELKAAVWDARNAGATVLLLDDRSERAASDDDNDSDGRDTDTALEKLIPLALNALHHAGDDSVTIRVLPPGRRHFATISSGRVGITRVGYPDVD